MYSAMATLPEIAVSAADQTAADAFVADLMGTDGETDEGDGADTSRVWHLHTKYYRARVRVRVQLDAVAVQSDSGTTEAHVVYLTENECSSAVCLERRVAGVDVSVRVVACDVTAAGVGDAVWAAARHHRYELIPLHPPAHHDDDDDEPWGTGAVRDALYAHLWHNLKRHDHHHLTNGGAADELHWSDSDEEAAGAGATAGDDEADVGESLERAEQLMSALAGVAGVRAAAAGAPLVETEAAWRAQRPERLRRAEDLLAAFTRALR